MMKYYSIRRSLWKDGEELEIKHGGYVLAEENEIKDRNYEVSWDDLEKYRFYQLYDVLENRRGKVVLFSNDPCIKQWKEPNLRLTIKIEYNEDKYVSIQKILNYPDVEKAIQYLKERGLSVTMGQ